MAVTNCVSFSRIRVAICARPQRGLRDCSWPDDESIEFHRAHGELLRLLRRCGFEVEDLIELYARLVPADDLEIRGAANSPSLFVDALAVAGR
mgnify:CR=1 FL=1